MKAEKYSELTFYHNFYTVQSHFHLPFISPSDTSPQPVPKDNDSDVEKFTAFMKYLAQLLGRSNENPARGR